METVQECIEKIKSYEEIFLNLSKRMMLAGGATYHVDILAVGVINRSLSLLHAFTTLIESSNYIGAVHLVRPHLDTYLRFSSVWLVNEPHEFVSKILKGEQIDKLKDKNGKFLKDFYLVEKAKEEYPWMENVYKVSSGFIHLSKKHALTASTALEDDGLVQFSFSKTDKHVPDESKIEGCMCMIETTECIIQLLNGWIETKKLN